MELEISDDKWFEHKKKELIKAEIPPDVLFLKLAEGDLLEDSKKD